MKKGNKKVISFTLIMALMLSTFLSGGAVSYGAETIDAATKSNFELSDIDSHWGEDYIKDAVAEGFVQGYEDGTFKPNNHVTRAEFVTMLNKALQLRNENTVNLLFSDVQETKWYYKDIQKASYAGYINGISDSLFMPGRNISREEAAAMLSRFLPKAGHETETTLVSYPDVTKISDWAKTAMEVVVKKGYLSGYKNGKLAPQAALTRAEAAKIIGSILDKETIVREDVSIKKTDQILKDKIYIGDITIDESVGEGDVDLQNLSALSKVYVLGGGANTVTLKDTVIIRLIVGKEGTRVRVLSDGGNTIHETFVFNDNLVVDGQGQGVENGDGGYENIIRLSGKISAETNIRIANEIAERIDNTGAITQQQVLDGVREIMPDAVISTDENGSIAVTVQSAPGTSGHSNHSNNDNSEPALTVNNQPAALSPITGAACSCNLPLTSAGAFKRL